MARTKRGRARDRERRWQHLTAWVEVDGKPQSVGVYHPLFPDEIRKPATALVDEAWHRLDRGETNIRDAAVEIMESCSDERVRDVALEYLWSRFRGLDKSEQRRFIAGRTARAEFWRTVAETTLLVLIWALCAFLGTLWWF